MKKRSALKLVLIIFIISLAFGSWHDIAFMNTKEACGKITGRIKGVRNHCYLSYSFRINHKIYHGEIPCLEIKRGLSLDRLKKINCIKVEYSTLNRSFNRIIDKRIIK